MIDQTQIEEWRKLCENATPPPWKLWAASVLHDPVGDSNIETALKVADTYCIRECKHTTHDAQFIAAARTAMPQLLDEIERLSLECDSLKIGAAFDRVWPVEDAQLKAIHDKGYTLRYSVSATGTFDGASAEGKTVDEAVKKLGEKLEGMKGKQNETSQ
jgi:hypothetical protein